MMEWRLRRLSLVAWWAVVALLAARGLPASRGFATTTPPLSPEELVARRQRGIEFVKAILNEPFETLPNLEPSDASLAGEEKEGAQGVMRVWRNIPDPYEGFPLNIVLRSNVEPFWQSCIDRIEIRSPDFVRYRVCAVGTPGTGKTYTTPLLLRMLLLQRSPVVYIRRSNNCKSCYFEFVPTPEEEPLEVTVNVYPETPIYLDCKIPSLSNTSTYFVVDPGKTQENCDPDEFFQARVIIISSPNEKNWGGKNIFKRNMGQVGTFRYYPLWNLSELLCGLGHLSSTLSPQQLVERYRQVGGTPRHLFADVEEYQNILGDQVAAVGKVKSWQALKIVNGDMDTVGRLDSESPKSAVIGITLADNDDGRFTEEKAVPISMAVAEEVFFVHIQAIWNDMVENERPLVFETYLRTLLTRTGRTIMVQSTEQGRRPAPDEPEPDPEPEQSPIIIGGYRGIQIVRKGQSIVKAAMENPNILFYSSDPRYPLIDFACRDSNGTILAFQATTRQQHTTDEKEIEKVENEVGNRTLVLFYLHPDRSGGFRTDPRKPFANFCRIYHVPILMPIQDTPSQAESAAKDPGND